MTKGENFRGTKDVGSAYCIRCTVGLRYIQGNVIIIDYSVDEIRKLCLFANATKTTKIRK